jgi:cation/acetate symporter
MPASFLVGIIISLLTKEENAERKYEEEKVRTYLGIGAE